MHVTQEKKLLRQSVLERLQRLSDRDRAAESRTISRQVLKHLPKEGAICGYVPLKTEPNILPVLEQILDRKQPLYLPCFQSDRLIFRRCDTLTELEPGPLRVPEPPKDAPLLQENNAVIALVPGRAFDRAGHRLGRGNGGFDRWMEERSRSLTEYWGVAFECQLLHQIPIEPHDQPIDRLITARGIQDCEDLAVQPQRSQ